MSSELRQLEFDDRDKYDRRDLEDNSIKEKRVARIKLLDEKIRYLNLNFHAME